MNILEFIAQIEETIADSQCSWGDFRTDRGLFEHYGVEFVPSHGLTLVQANRILRLAAESNGALLGRLLAAHGIVR